MWACYEVLDFLSGTNGENLPANAGDAKDKVRSLSQEDPLE